MGYNQGYRWANPTYPIYNQAYSLLTKRDEPPSRMAKYGNYILGHQYIYVCMYACMHACMYVRMYTSTVMGCFMDMMETCVYIYTYHGMRIIN